MLIWPMIAFCIYRAMPLPELLTLSQEGDESRDYVLVSRSKVWRPVSPLSPERLLMNNFTQTCRNRVEEAMPACLPGCLPRVKLPQSRLSHRNIAGMRHERNMHRA